MRDGGVRDGDVGLWDGDDRAPGKGTAASGMQTTGFWGQQPPGRGRLGSGDGGIGEDVVEMATSGRMRQGTPKDRRFVMPTSKDGNNPKGTSVEKDTVDASPHVLVVDDSLVDRCVISMALKSYNIRVTVVEGPKQALEVLDVEHDVKMIVTDYCMPDMTGYGLLLEVKKSPKLRHIPVVIVSSDNIPERIKMCLDGGAMDYILKPIKAADVPHILSYI
ncbi:two-component response regulator ORR12-like [Phragmites australis]|uniref:two-component response regulator ORR12-like n=1 Tax=Phragmites australis TaxID=29695 RepID=UPI002D7692C5|nr:two-component response regulator ORR12-like [Phragmites australis]